MQTRTKLEGDTGDLRWGYRTAGRLEAWRLHVGQDEHGAPTSRLSARVADVDRFAVARADRVRVRVGRKWWSWRTCGAQIVDGRIEMILAGRPEVVG